MENYTALMDKLRSRELKELKITQEEFMDFQRAYMDYAYRNQIVGEALRGGGAIYHFSE